MKTLTKILSLGILGFATLSCENPINEEVKIPVEPTGIVNVNFPEAPYTYSIQIFSKDNSGTKLSGGINAGETKSSLSLKVGDYSIGATGIEYKRDPRGNLYPISHYSTTNPKVSVKSGQSSKINLYMGK
jgi:hypothetical protein